MGSKLNLKKEDSFISDKEEEVSGIVGGCFCCSQNIHVTFNHLEASPIALVDNAYFYIIVCDQCEEDIEILKENGVSKISYDLLWLIQDDLKLESSKKVNKEGIISLEDHTKILVKLYKDAETKIKIKNEKEYLSKLTFNGDKNKN